MLHKHSISPHLTSYPAQFYVSHNIKLYVKVLKRRLFLRFCEDPSVLPVNIQHVNIFNTAPEPTRVFSLKKVWPGSARCHHTTSCIGQSNTCKFHIPGGFIYKEKLVYFFISVQCFDLWIRLYMHMQGWTSLLYVLGALRLPITDAIPKLLSFTLSDLILRNSNKNLKCNQAYSISTSVMPVSLTTAVSLHLPLVSLFIMDKISRCSILASVSWRHLSC